ncbi:MAG: zf-HC2 domain-containing protein [Lachnospiraceae bacterium]|nr:zf-HC2 domain-containing protein [Lachnospiraceae bacterium]
MNKSEKKYNCDIIQDLLPLYQDSICSDASKSMVEEHLEECPSCKDILNQLKNTYLDDHLTLEKNNVLEAHLKQEKRRTFTIGLCTAGILMIPVIVCLICNLAIGHALDWFFIVLASLLLVASLSVVPLMAPAKHAGICTIGGFTGSLVLLLAVICIYVHGNWFFLAVVPTIFGLSLFLMPYVVYHIPLPNVLTNHKGLLVMLWDTVWLYAIIIVCGFHTMTPGYWRIALEITSYCVLIPWFVFLVIRYLKVHPFIRAGISSCIVGLFTSLINSIVELILYGKAESSILNADFSNWTYPTNNANVSVCILIASLSTGIVLMCIGILLQYRKTNAK